MMAITGLFKNWILLLCMAAVLVVMFLLCGCDGRGGRIETRMVCAMETGTNRTNAAWFRYVGYDGDPVEQPGLTMEVYNPDGGIVCSEIRAMWFDGIWIETTGVTGSNGAVFATGHRDWENYATLYCMDEAYFSKPYNEDDDCRVGGMMDYGTRETIESRNEQCFAAPQGELPAWAEALHGIAGDYNLTDEERAGLSSGELPSHGFDYTVSMVQQKGSLGNGSCDTMDSLVPFNFRDAERIFSYAYPVAYSVIVKTAGPVQLAGQTFSAKVYTGACPGGTIMGLNVLAENEEETVHILRTDYFLPEEAKCYYLMFHGIVDPNNPIDPNGFSAGADMGAGVEMAVYDRWTPDDNIDYGDSGYYDNPDVSGTEVDLYSDGFQQSENYSPDREKACWVIPIFGEDDYVEIEFILNSDAISLIAPSWLTSDKSLDMNNDGTVNLKDVYF